MAYDAINGILDVWKADFIGTWLHKGQIHIDPVKIYENREDAVEAGIRNEQIAIYSFETGEIFL